VTTVAALFVERGGVYWGLDGVDPWDEARDARTYAGPWPVVAHPPCERWGSYWHGGPNSERFPRERRKLGDDAGCFAAAIAAVRRFGGVLEHPANSHAWKAFGLIAPPSDGAWVAAGDFIGWTCRVEQGHFGHKARKGTWLYCAGVSSLPTLPWQKSAAAFRLDDSFNSAAERAEWKARGGGKRHGGLRLTKGERKATPPAFRDLLLSIARASAASEPS
jgi:hypothetical protein